MFEKSKNRKYESIMIERDKKIYKNKGKGIFHRGIPANDFRRNRELENYLFSIPIK